MPKLPRAYSVCDSVFTARKLQLSRSPVMKPCLFLLPLALITGCEVTLDESPEVAYLKLPARSTLGASGLALGARVEIECIAIVD